jgi:hypothetical protein
MLERLKENPNAPLQDPDYDPSVDEKKAIVAFKNAGWSEREIQLNMASRSSRIENVTSTSPGVNPDSELFFKSHCDAIEVAIAELGFTSIDNVARGIEPRLGPYAARTNVIMTEESIVTVGSQLFRFCGVIGKAFVRTINVDPFAWENKEFTQKKGENLVKQNVDLLFYWKSIFMSYCFSGMHIGVPFKPANKDELIFVEQVAQSMEIFAIAHEYGHHHYSHGRQLDAQQFHREEFEADKFALKVSSKLGCGLNSPNT